MMVNRMNILNGWIMTLIVKRHIMKLNDFLEDALFFSIGTLYFCVIGFSLAFIIGYFI